MSDLRFPLLVIMALAVGIIGGCGSGSDYEPPEDPATPTVTISATSILLSGTVTRKGTTMTQVTVDREPATINGMGWTYSVANVDEDKTCTVEYWLDNRLIESQTVTITRE